MFLFCFGLGSHNYIYEIANRGLLILYVIDQSRFSTEDNIFCLFFFLVCEEPLQSISMEQLLEGLIGSCDFSVL